jgi:hypothetical protein
MGGGGIRCTIGFSIDRSNDFSEQLERRSAAMERSFRDGFFRLQQGIGRLHDAVDAALVADEARAAERFTAGLGDLAGCNAELTALGEELVRMRADLFERGEVDASDPLVTREPFFAGLDYEGIYADLLAHGAALPRHVFWDEVATRVREGGSHGGLRLLDRQLRELQSDLRSFTAVVESIGRLRGAAFARALHDTSRDIATVMLGYTRLLTTFTYLAILCEQASALQEQALAEMELTAVAS